VINRMRVRCAAALLLALAWSGATPAQQHGCEVESVSLMDFGSPAANPTSAATTTSDVVIRCEGNGSERGATVQVCVGIAPVAQRAMRRGLLFPPPLTYGIYGDPAHSRALGYDGARLSTVLTMDESATGRATGSARVTLHGRIDPGQTGLPAGTYGAVIEGDVRSSLDLSANCDTLPRRDSFITLSVARLAESCQVTASDLSFGVHTTLATAVNAVGEIQVQCTFGTAYRARMDGGIVNGNVAGRAMARAGGGPMQKIGYELRHTGPSGPLWGDGTAGTTEFQGEGTGSSQAINVYGRVPGGQTGLAVGDYSDTVTVTVEY
jgi:spore coat protein U-like protein